MKMLLGFVIMIVAAIWYYNKFNVNKKIQGLTPVYVFVKKAEHKKIHEEYYDSELGHHGDRLFPTTHRKATYFFTYKGKEYTISDKDFYSTGWFMLENTLYINPDNDQDYVTPAEIAHCKYCMSLFYVFLLFAFLLFIMYVVLD